MERLTNKTVARLAKATQEGYFVKMGREERLDAQYLVNQSPEHSELYCRLFELEERIGKTSLQPRRHFVPADLWHSVLHRN